MSLGQIELEHLRRAMTEADALGRAGFCGKYGFGFATTYLVSHDGKFYDPKALIGAAHGFVPDRESLKVDELDSTEAIQRLRRLQFTVVEFNGLWWVNQGATYRAERDGGFVWAPKQSKAGRPVPHHVAVRDLKVGQKVVHCANGLIRAIGTVAEPPVSQARPAGLDSTWDEDGYLCRVAYHDLAPPIPKGDVPNRTPELGPFDVNGNLKQAYLTRINDAELFPVLEILVEHDPTFFGQVEASELPELRSEKEQPLMRDTQLLDLLRTFKNVVLEGVPGTGKSYAVESIAALWEQRTGRTLCRFGDQPFTATVMHPSTSYEDFIEGLRPTSPEGPTEAHFFDSPASGDGQFSVDDGFFLRACSVAARNPNTDVLVLLDELNRCNISSVLGDLLLTLEASRRAQFTGPDKEAATAADWLTAVPVTLPYSRRTFFVPENLYVIATTNTTDRSVAPVDAAIRRRFAFVRLEPDFTGPKFMAASLPDPRSTALMDSIEQLETLNASVLGACLGPDAMLGHSYAFAIHARLLDCVDEEIDSTILDMWRYSVVPQLIDSLRSYGAEDLLSRQTRAQWFVDHGSEMDDAVPSAKAVLEGFDVFLRALGLQIVVQGTGLARGARVARWEEPVLRADIGHPEVAVEADTGRSSLLGDGASS